MPSQLGVAAAVHRQLLAEGLEVFTVRDHGQGFTAGPRIEAVLAPGATDAQKARALELASDPVFALEARRATTRRVLDAKARAAIERAFPPSKQRSLLALALEARALGYVERSAYVAKAWEWIFSVLGAHEQLDDSLATSDDPEGVSLDLSSFDAAGASPPPAVSLRAARALNR